MSHVGSRAEQTRHARRALTAVSTVAMAASMLLAVAGCADGDALEGQDDVEVTSDAIACEPRMVVFPVAAPHNIGYDGSCTGGPCPISCPDAHANSDWNVDQGGDHHGIDVFAYQGAPLVAVADATVVAAGTVSNTSGIRVKLRDACGWNYYYGHMDAEYVSVGQTVIAGEVIGTMGRTGAASTHLHFNISPGDYNNDIDPFDLLAATSGTACDAEPPPAEPPPAEPPPAEEQPADPGEEPPADPGEAPPADGCGSLAAGNVLDVNGAVTSCDGRFVLVMQDDGNLVLYQSGVGALWSAFTAGHPGSALAMQDDGNLVIYASSGQAIWNTGTNGHAGASLAVQDDGNVVVYGAPGALWNTGTSGH